MFFRRLFACSMMSVVVLFGFGCAKAPESTPVVLKTYSNEQYGIIFDYPENMETKDRTESRMMKYAGLDVDFFASLRDIKREVKATNIAAIYAAKALTTDQFVTALGTLGANAQIKNTQTEVYHGLTVKKIVTSTDIGSDKTYYVLERNGNLVIFSVFLGQETFFESVLQTLRP